MAYTVDECIWMAYRVQSRHGKVEYHSNAAPNIYGDCPYPTRDLSIDFGDRQYVACLIPKILVLQYLQGQLELTCEDSGPVLNIYVPFFCVFPAETDDQLIHIYATEYVYTIHRGEDFDNSGPFSRIQLSSIKM